MKKALSVLLSLVLAIGMFGGVSATAFAQDKEVVTVKFEQTEARKMLTLVNEFRTSGSWCWDESNSKKVKYPAVKALKYDYDLERSAMIRAAEITKLYDHTRPNGKGPETALNDYGTCGENIAWTEGYGLSAEHVFGLWKEEDKLYNEQGHRRNMLNGEYGAIGIACCYVNGRYYWVQEFRDFVIDPNKSPANDGYTDATIDYSGTVKPSLVGVKAPALKAPTVKVTSPKKKAVKISWNSQPNIKNYQLQYSYNKNFKDKKTKNIDERYGSMTINGMKSKKTVYVRMRAKSKSTGKYTKWSKVKKVKIK